MEKVTASPSPPPPTTGDVWVGTTKHRRVLGSANGFVLYSNGGNTNRECRLTTFTRWIRRQKATKQQEEQQCAE